VGPAADLEHVIPLRSTLVLNRQHMHHRRVEVLVAGEVDVVPLCRRPAPVESPRHIHVDVDADALLLGPQGSNLVVVIRPFSRTGLAHGPLKGVLPML
jgi:hypothetical protein